MDVGVTVEMGKVELRFERAGSSALSTLGAWGGGSRETSEQLLVGRRVWPHIHPSSPSPSTVINKYKRRRFQKTKNLLTGETEADPEMIKVREQSPWVPGAPGCSCPAARQGLSWQHHRAAVGARSSLLASLTLSFPLEMGLGS